MLGEDSKITNKDSLLEVADAAKKPYAMLKGQILLSSVLCTSPAHSVLAN